MYFFHLHGVSVDIVLGDIDATQFKTILKCG